MIRFRRALFAALLLGGLAVGPTQAGSLAIFEASAGQGRIRTIAGPVSNALIDLDYAPVTAEGGKLYGMSEIELEATGDLVLSPTGFACQATWCLYSPSPFVAGKRIRITGGNDVAGEISAVANLLKLGVTGSTGHIVLVRGEYLDGSGPSSSVGTLHTVDVRALVTVPEVELSIGLIAGCGLLSFASGSRLRRHDRRNAPTRARASARSGFVPCRPAPRGR